MNEEGYAGGTQGWIIYVVAEQTCYGLDRDCLTVRTS